MAVGRKAGLGERTAGFAEAAVVSDGSVIPGNARLLEENGDDMLWGAASTAGDDREAEDIWRTPIGAWLPQVSISFATDSPLTDEVAEGSRSGGALGGGDSMCGFGEGSEDIGAFTTAAGGWELGEPVGSNRGG